jgi:hypothetical protein
MESASRSKLAPWTRIASMVVGLASEEFASPTKERFPCLILLGFWL